MGRWLLAIAIVAFATLGIAHSVTADTPASPVQPSILIDGDPNVVDYVIWHGPRPSPVTMYYDPLGETWPVPDSVIAAALTEWNSVSPAFQYVYGGRIAPGAGQTNTCTSSEPNGTNTISWANLTGLTVARACVWSTSPECDIQLDTTTQPILLQAEALRTVLLHEAGHCLGLAHSNDSTAVMWPVYSIPKHLAADDIAGVCVLYGCASVPPTATPTPSLTPTPTRTATPTATPTPRPPARIVVAFLAKS